MNYKWIILSFGLFAAGCIGGLVTPGAGEFVSEYIADLEGFGAFLESSSFTMMLFIFLKNVLALVIGFAFSPFLCLAPFFTLVINGWVLAVVGDVIVQAESLGYLLAGILPHGIIELPALFIGQAAALHFGYSILRALFVPQERSQLLSGFRTDIRYLAIACLLLIPAAAIETYLTPLFLD